MGRFVCLSFCVSPNWADGYVLSKIEQMAQSSFSQDVDDNKFWQDLLQRMIMATQKRFSGNTKTDPAIKTIYDHHLNWLNTLSTSQDRAQNVSLLWDVQRANLRLEALVERIVQKSSLPWIPLPRGFLDPILSQEESINKQIHALKAKILASENVTEKEYDDCCNSIQGVSLALYGILSKINDIFCESLNKIHIEDIWGDNKRSVMRELFTLLLSSVGQGKSVTKKMVVRGGDLKVKLKCRFSCKSLDFYFKTRIFRSNKSVYRCFGLTLESNEISMTEETAYLRFRRFLSQEFRNNELSNWRMLLRASPHVLPMTPKIKNGIIKGAITPWCRDGDLFSIVSDPERLTAWSMDNRIRCLIQMLRVLNKLHSLNGVDTDFKTANVLRKDESSVWRTDFGSIHRARHGVFCGSRTTREYTSPEQLSPAWTPDTSLDMWAAGLFMVELFHGIEANIYVRFDWLKKFCNDPKCPESIKKLLKGIFTDRGDSSRWPDQYFTDPQYVTDMQLLWGIIRDKLVESLDPSHPTTSLITRLLSCVPKNRPTAKEAIRELKEILSSLAHE